MENYMDKLASVIDTAVPERRIVLTVTAPGFVGSGAVNTGFGRVMLTDADQRKRSQQQIVDAVSPDIRQLTEARTFVIQEQTISAGGGPRGTLPVQFVVQAETFEKLKDAIPKFMNEVNQNPVFQGSDVNLKFNRPELQVTIDRERARNLGVSVQDVAQTLQLSFSGQRFGYFTMKGKQYQVIGQFDRANRDETIDLRSIYVRSASGELVQLDNLVKIEEESSPPQLYHYNRYMSATVQAGLAPGKPLETVLRRWKR
jgi:multidrug efflux pump